MRAIPVRTPICTLGAVLVMLAALSVVSGCGGSTPVNFHSAEAMTPEPAVAALIAAWATGQQTQDPDALQDTYDPDYTYNGQTPHDMAETFLVPHTHDTQVRSATHTILEPPDGHQAHTTNADQHDHLVMVRVNVRGVVSASVVSELAAASGGDDTGDDDVHVHSAAVAPSHEDADDGPPGVVAVTGRFDVIMGIDDVGAGDPRICSQRIHIGQLVFGGGMSATVLDALDAHPEEVHPGHAVDAHGRYSLLPPGGAIQAQIGGGDPVAATIASGALQASLVAPTNEGTFLVSVRAVAGDVFTRTAALTIAEREVHVHHD